MIAIAKDQQEPGTVSWQDGFLEVVPTIEKHARIAFRRMDPDRKEDAISEVIANAMCAYRRLYERGELQRAFATVLAKYAVAQYRDGRRVGTPQCSRDVFSNKAQRRQGFGVHSIDDHDPDGRDWIECLIDQRRSPVPEQVAFRIDFPRWLADQSSRDQHIVEQLSKRYTTSEVASEFEISPARVSQLRRELAESWQEFNSANSKPTSTNQINNNPKAQLKELSHA